MEPEKHSMTIRSPLMMNRDDSALIVIDVQAKLLPHIPNARHLVWNIRRLLDGAQTLGVFHGATEQYPRGLGETDPMLRGLVGDSILEKTMFSCRECVGLVARLQASSITKVLLVGIETHVCVAQTALDFLAAGFDVLVAVDAIGSRFDLDREVALRRMETSGVVLTTTEAALFEWCERAGTPEFKAISRLVQEPGPSRESIGFGGD